MIIKFEEHTLSVLERLCDTLEKIAPALMVQPLTEGEPGTANTDEESEDSKNTEKAATIQAVQPPLTGLSEEVTIQKVKDEMDFEFKRLALHGIPQPKIVKTFKDISKWLGAEKPSALPPERRQKFIDEIKSINAAALEKGDWVPF